MPNAKNGSCSLLGCFFMLGAMLSGCASPTQSVESLHTAAFVDSMVFPADRSLNRAEDGVALPDGRLIVSDKAHGLRLVARDGSSTLFGSMPAAGYRNDPPSHHGAANGVSLDPDGRHVLVADVLGGGIYRVAIDTGATELAYQHAFGVNTAVRDSTGAIWFTQSTECTGESGEARLFAAVDIPVADGALWRLGFHDGRFESKAELVRSGLYFANGIVLDERNSTLYIAETCRDRVLSTHLDVAAGRIGELSTFASLPTPDNLELDAHGRLWIASPIGNEVRVVNTKDRTSRPAFRQQTAFQSDRAAEFVRRGGDSSPRIELFSPEIWEPLPGAVTGIILGAANGEVYITGLGNALIRVPHEQAVAR